MKNENIKQVYMALLELGFEPFYLQSLSDD